MRKILKITIIGLFAGFLVIQFIRPEQTNPAIVRGETLESKMPVPEKVNAILQRSCNDCHTNNTIYPWYSKITPFNWLLADHIEVGRKELNFSVWNSYDNSRQRRKLNEVCEQVTSREMPLPSYLWIHRDAKLTEEDVKLICDWADSERLNLAQKE